MSVHAGLSESQTAVLDAFRTVFAGEAPLGAARAAEPLGFDADLWQHMQAIGAPALGLPESHDGAGVGTGDLVVMAEEVGRSIASVPLIEHTVAARVLARLDAPASLVAGLADGTAIATLALRPADASRWSLVPAGAVAHVVVGVDGDSVVALRSEPSGVAPPNHACSPLAHRSTAGAIVVGPAAAFETALAEWRLLTAAALVGIAAAALDLGVGYVKDRHQFGVPIGTFQAVQHQLADLPGMIDGARLLVHEAAWALDGHAPDSVVDVGFDHVTDGSVLAHMAFLFAADVAATATSRSLHVHGGYGFSEEYDIQLLYRRARGWALVAGDLPGAYRHLADRLLEVAP